MSGSQRLPDSSGQLPVDRRRRPQLGVPSGCPALAIGFAAAMAVVAALMFRGAAVSGLSSSWRPCGLTALMLALAVNAAGRLTPKIAACIAGSGALLAVLAGRVLVWDLAGVMSRFSRQDVTSGTWLERLLAGWDAMPAATRWLQVGLWTATPVAAALAAIWMRPDVHAESIEPGDSPARDHVGQATAIQDSADRWNRWYIGGVGLWLAIVATSHGWFGWQAPNAFLRMTLPVVPINQTNTLLGFAHLRDGRPQMCEEIPAIEQVTWFLGQVRSDNNFRFARAGHAFLAAQLAPVGGPEGSLLVLNILAWLLGVACVGRVATRLFQSALAGCLAALLSAPGVGWAMHWNSTTPHVLSFGLYMVGVLVFLETDLASRRLPWSTHLAMGVAIGLISLVYNVAQMLLLVYFAVGWRTQRWRHLCGGGLMALAFQPVWHLVLPALGINLLDVEAGYLSRTLAKWWSWLATEPLTFVTAVGRLTAEAVTSLESPWVLLLGLIGCVNLGSNRHREVVFWSLVAPVLACVVFAPSASARGYIVYGSSLLWMAAGGGWLANCVQAGRWRRSLAIVVMVLATSGQLAWSLAITRGGLPPIIGYFAGWDDAAPLVAKPPAEIRSLTGRDAIPRLWTNRGPTGDSHILPTPPSLDADRRSYVLTYLTRLVFVTGISILLGLTIQRTSARRVAVAVWLVFAALATEAGWRSSCPLPVYRDLSQGIRVSPGESLRLTLSVPNSIRRQLVREAAAGHEVRWYIPTASPCELQWRINGHPIPVAPAIQHEAIGGRIDVPDAAAEFDDWTIDLRNTGREPLTLAGWQHVEAPGKSLSSPQATCWPAIEVRVREPKTGRLVWLGF